jgi:hypothetical protein
MILDILAYTVIALAVTVFLIAIIIAFLDEEYSTFLTLCIIFSLLVWAIVRVFN